MRHCISNLLKIMTKPFLLSLKKIYVQHPWSSSLHSVFPRSPVSLPQEISGKNYNIMTHEPKEDDPYICPSFNWDGILRTAIPEGIYGDKYSLAMHMKPNFVCSMHFNFCI